MLDAMTLSGYHLGMESKPASSGLQPSTPSAFGEALTKIASIPRAEMQKRIKTVPEVPVSRHTRYKYVPAKPPQNS